MYIQYTLPRDFLNISLILHPLSGRRLEGSVLAQWLFFTGMALGFFILGPRTRMSGQIGVPSILGASQNLGDPAPPPSPKKLLV